MVYGSVKQSGGFVWADSAPGRGTVIEVCWPEIQGEPEQLSETKETSTLKGGTETIILAEDDATLRSLCERTLAGLGYRCLAVGSAEEVLRLLEAGEAVDLVITDVVMAGMSGGGLGERLALERPGLPLLFISGFADEDVIGRGLARGRPTIPAETLRPLTSRGRCARCSTGDGDYPTYFRYL